MLIHDVKRRVLYAETDQMGYLYYGHYASYYESGRVELIRSCGLNYRDMEEVDGVMMPVAHLQCTYKSPAYYDDLLTIRTILPTLPRRIFHVKQEVYNEDGLLINQGEVKLFFIDIKSNKAISCPKSILDVFRAYF